MAVNCLIDTTAYTFLYTHDYAHSKSAVCNLLGGKLTAVFVVLQFISLLSELGTHRVTDLVSQNVDRFAPLFVGDHMVAV